MFSGCSFRHTRLNDAGMGGGKAPNIFEGCEFHRADLRNSSQGSARYRDCRFVDCRLTRVHFDAVELGAGRIRRWLARPEPLGLDLARAVPRWCEFVGYDLSACVLPRVPGVITFDRRRDVAERVLAGLGADTELVVLRITMERELSDAPRRNGGGPGFQVVSALGDTEAERAAAERVLRTALALP